MKNYSELLNDINEYYKDEFKLKSLLHINPIFKVEIMLYVLDEFGFEGKDISKGWAILSGYNYDRGLNVNINEYEWNLLDKARGFVPELRGASTYRNFINKYIEYKEINKLLYILENGPNNSIIMKRNNSNNLKKRKMLIKNLFNKKITVKENSKRVVDFKEGYIINEGQTERIKFSKEYNSLNNRLKYKVVKNKEIKPIFVSKNDLLKTAELIDQKIKNRNYKNRINNIKFDVIENDKIIEKDTISIDGLFNLVGRVGAGKSTLIEVLTIKLAMEGKKVALIVDSIKSIFELIDLFYQMDIKAVPITGYSGRQNHISKAYSNVREENFLDIYNTSYNKWLSETCILDGLREGSDILKPFISGKEPCLSIQKNFNEKESFGCPYYNICPSHLSERELENAIVYITTPAAFIKSRISPIVVDGDVRVSEYLYYNCDLVVFDESDRVLQNFEQSFTEHLVLLDEEKIAYLDKLGGEVSNWFYRNRLKNANNKSINKWYNSFINTQRISNILIETLNDNKYLVKKLNGTFVTALSLYDKFKSDFSFNIDNTMHDILYKYILSSYGELDDIGKSILNELLSGENIDIKNKLRKWYFKEEKVSDETVLILNFIFILISLEKNFKLMVNGIEEIPELQKLNIGNANILYKGIQDYISIIPTFPPGNKFGIRITADSNNNLKRLVIFRSKGIGRWLLTNYNTLYYNIEKIKGPNVILLSGTSWAPNSYSYHINAQVNCILKGLDEEAKAIEKSEFFFEPIFGNSEVLNVSGTDLNRRIDVLKNIIDKLIRPSIKKKAPLVKELEHLEEGRKRILLVVGSYDEAAAIKYYLNSILTNEGEIRNKDVCLLVKDGEDNNESEGISRGQVAEFGLSEYKILIAPLMALERGYNILNEYKKAAIGSVYFLVRPMPIPNDLSIIVNKINFSFMNELSKKNSIDIHEHINWVKDIRDKHLKLMQELLIKSDRLGYRQLEDKDREALCMTLFVTICQVIGRLIRGGCKARVHFCDGKFAPKSVVNEEDTSKTSILVGIIETLDKLLNSENNIEKEIAKKLYGPFIKGLKECEGLRYGR